MSKRRKKEIKVTRYPGSPNWWGTGIFLVFLWASSRKTRPKPATNSFGEVRVWWTKRDWEINGTTCFFFLIFNKLFVKTRFENDFCVYTTLVPFSYFMCRSYTWVYIVLGISNGSNRTGPKSVFDLVRIPTFKPEKSNLISNKISVL